MTRSVMWFRRDLRVDDHPALSEACGSGEVLPLFVDDPAFARSGLPRQALLHDAVAALARATGGSLVIRAGDPVEVVATVAAEVGAETVFVSKDFGPYGRRRDQAVAAALRTTGARLRGVGSPYAVDPGSITKPDDSPYSVFTPFSRRWREHGWPTPVAAPIDPAWITASSDSTLRRPELAHAPVIDWSERWTRFAGAALADYRRLRDVPSADGTSRLSAMIRFGVVHPRQLLAELDPFDPDHQAFASELAWRDFYADVLFHRPESAWSNLDHRFDRIDLDTGPIAEARFEAWTAGRTGFPIVDAGMRQLAETGWMHNRVRMIVASFLVKDLHLPWQWGASHFMRHLLDADLASNNHGWQWAAGSGTDAAPYFRVFNPTTQRERYDPAGEYCGRWIAELGSSAYPAPIVDHAAERVEALARYSAIKT